MCWRIFELDPKRSYFPNLLFDLPTECAVLRSYGVKLICWNQPLRCPMSIRILICRNNWPLHSTMFIKAVFNKCRPCSLDALVSGFRLVLSIFHKRAKWPVAMLLFLPNWILVRELDFRSVLLVLLSLHDERAKSKRLCYIMSSFFIRSLYCCKRK